MFSWLGRYKVVGKVHMNWVDDNDAPIYRYIGLLLINPAGTTKVKFKRLYRSSRHQRFSRPQITSHKIYSHLIIPWLYKTGWARDLTREQLIEAVKELDSWDWDGKRKVPSDNVVNFPKR